MKPTWDDVNARARGLATRLLGRSRLEELYRVTSLSELAGALERAGYPWVVAGRTATAEELERSLRRYAQDELAIVARWCGERIELLRVLFEDEDRRSLRSLVRGAASGVSPERRLAGLVPTPSLPERALAELARLPTAAAIAATLAVWGNDYGEAMREEAVKAHLDLFRIEISLNRLFAARAVSAVRWRGRELRRLVEESIDLENAVSALVLSRHPAEAKPEESFLEGGRLLDIESFLVAARSPSPTSLARAFRGTAFSEALRDAAEDPEDVERTLLRLRIDALVARARLEPLSAAPLFAFVLRLRAEAIDLRDLVWSLTMGAPRSTAALVSA